MIRWKSAPALMALCLTGSLLLAGCGEEEASSSEPRRFTTTFVSHMDTVVNFTAYCESSGAFDRAARIVSDALAEADALYDRYAEESALARLNASGGEWVAVPEPLRDLLDACREWQAETGGVNFALGKVSDLWREARLTASLPDRAALSSALNRADPAALELEAGRGRLTDPETSLDLGCAAKGAAADRAAERLLAAGFADFLLDCGTSSLRCAGSPPGRAGWSIALTNPDSRLNLSGAADPAQTLGTLLLADAAVGVSGDYQRFFMADGQVISHILDPETGMPARFVRMVCVLSDSAARADFLSTALFARPFSVSWETARRLPGTACLFVLPDGTVRRTPGFPPLTA